MKRLLGALAAALFLLAWFPAWTARWVEARRLELLRRSADQVQGAPACPADDSFAEYVGRRQTHLPSGALWRPLCRKAEPPTRGAALVFASEERYRQCREELLRFPLGSAVCWLDPPIQFLADPRAKRTIARRAVARQDGTEVIWATTMHLAWGEQLQEEHRAWIALGVFLAMFTSLVRESHRRWRRAGLLQRELGSAGSLPPARMERLALCVLPPFNYPQEVDDLRESYLEKVATEGRTAAALWYRSQVRRSLAYYLGQRLAGLLRGTSRRSSTTRR